MTSQLVRLLPVVAALGLIACSGDNKSDDAATATTPIVPTTAATATRPATAVATPASTTPAPTPVLNFTLDQLKNAEYTVNNQKIKLENGMHLLKPPGFPGSYQMQTKLLETPVAYGELTGDAAPDAAVILVWDGGGSGRFYELVAMANQGGSPVFKTSIALGDRVIVNSLVIAAGVINLDVTFAGPSDPACCPTMRKMVRYRLTGDKLVEI